jgi:hypothetical protein
MAHIVGKCGMASNGCICLAATRANKLAFAHFAVRVVLQMLFGESRFHFFSDPARGDVSDDRSHNNRKERYIAMVENHN